MHSYVPTDCPLSIEIKIATGGVRSMSQMTLCGDR